MSKPILFNSKGSQVRSQQISKSSGITQKAQGLYGNIFGYGNAGRYKYRYYTLGDTAQGLDTYSRELLVRWSREMYAQLPIVSSAIKIKAQFSVGDGFIPEYKGINSQWGKIAEDWLKQQWFPNCCTRGSSYNFNTCLDLFSQQLDVDGDFLQVFGTDKYGFPLFQIITSHRIKTSKDNSILTEGQYKNCIVSDGVIYSPNGQALAFCVENASNMVNNGSTQTPSMIFDSKDAQLVFQKKYFDKHRGVPSISPAILQAISLQELDQYEMDKAKMNSMIGYVEKNASGEAPQELQNTLQSLLQDSNNGGNSLLISPNDHALKIINGPEIRYIRAEGGDIKSFQTNGPTSEAQNYMTKLEIQVLSTLGIPAQLIFHPDKVGGRVTSAVAEIFRNEIVDRQKLLRQRAAFMCGWALSKAMNLGLIPENNEENLTTIFDFSLPPKFSLDAKYDNDIIIDNYNNGVTSLNDTTLAISNKTATQVLAEQKKEQIEFYNNAKEVSTATGVELQTVISNWRQTAVKTTVTMKAPTEEDNSNEQ